MDRPNFRKGRFLRVQSDPLPVTVPGRIPPDLRKYVGKSYLSYRRVKLWVLQSGKCHWCDRDCILLEPQAKRGPLPDNAATVDHLRSRLDPKRSEPARGEVRQVMACNRCNHRRASEEMAARPLDAKHADSQRSRQKWDDECR